MKKHFVTFHSPGSFVDETTTMEIDSWDKDKACEMAGEIVERYNARPYGFIFSTRERTDEELDSKVVETSAFHFMGGEIVERDKVTDDVVRRNMENQGAPRVWKTTRSWLAWKSIPDGAIFCPEPEWMKQLEPHEAQVNAD